MSRSRNWRITEGQKGGTNDFVLFFFTQGRAKPTLSLGKALHYSRCTDHFPMDRDQFVRLVVRVLLCFLVRFLSRRK